MGAAAGGGAIGFDRLSTAEHTRAIHQASRCKFQHHASTATKRRASIRDNGGGLPSGEAAAYTPPVGCKLTGKLSIMIYTPIA